MNWWHPKPLRPEDPNPLFEMDQDESYTVKSMTPMQRQRYEDGTLHSMNRPSKYSPKDVSLFIGEDHVEKAQEEQQVEKSESLDADGVVKAFMNKSKDDEDEEKSVGEAAGSAVGGAVKTGVKLATGAAKMANKTKQ